MKIDVFTDSLSTGKAPASALRAWLATHGRAPDFVALHCSVQCLGGDMQGVFDTPVALHGATSCLGVMGESGPKIDGGYGAFAIWDENGDYGTSMAAIADDPRGAAATATRQALITADRAGEAPVLVWLSASPGQEELILAGVEDVVGQNVPILGGSAADDHVSGDWRVFDATRQLGSGVIVSVLFPSRPVSFAYHNGYAPTSHAGTVTAADGRILREIDNRPAAQVYRDWIGDGVIPAWVETTTPILSESTMTPLGRYLNSVGGVPYYLLAHPAALTPQDELELFADIDVGDELTLMSGAPDQLTRRAGKVASLAAEIMKRQPDAIAGSLVVYCGGCMLAVRDQLDDVASGISEALPGVPFLGIFTFGEQGVVLDGRNRHGNLMISAIVFGA